MGHSERIVDNCLFLGSSLHYFRLQFYLIGYYELISEVEYPLFIFSLELTDVFFKILSFLLQLSSDYFHMGELLTHFLALRLGHLLQIGLFVTFVESVDHDAVRTEHVITIHAEISVLDLVFDTLVALLIEELPIPLCCILILDEVFEHFFFAEEAAGSCSGCNCLRAACSTHYVRARGAHPNVFLN